ncbi:hypothetical protein H7J87_20800 [Mycolicibacterium wolinskyi]|nr:hypothetical protein [Mycolicibacterium wolinskyi]MCV7294664.1 hypothetical protein [Mycolicibacterium goodii]
MYICGDCVTKCVAIMADRQIETNSRCGTGGVLG